MLPVAYINVVPFMKGYTTHTHTPFVYHYFQTVIFVVYLSNVIKIYREDWFLEIMLLKEQRSNGTHVSDKNFSVMIIQFIIAELVTLLEKGQPLRNLEEKYGKRVLRSIIFFLQKLIQNFYNLYRILVLSDVIEPIRTENISLQSSIRF